MRWPKQWRPSITWIRPRRTTSGGESRSIAFAGEFDAALGDVAAFRAQQVGDRLERRGLAGAVGAEKSDDAPLGNRQRHATQHQDDVIVDHLDVVDREQRRRSHLRRSDGEPISSPWRSRAA